ncbi:hypothetical protein GQ55_9G309800 [Panicum hallii var. hallii]|uniref:Uncharacterized protein n=1 Tax=Panicum hallii var. hallii TaxID=1504633 RepID=A0A2T7C7Y2_9POAL|nr:hypothetical protein GQ55_9G309800 [Panicum hallii var. hallii]
MGLGFATGRGREKIWSGSENPCERASPSPRRTTSPQAQEISGAANRRSSALQPRSGVRA